MPESPGADRLRSKLVVFTNLASDLSGLSTCKRLKVGCAVAPPDMTEVLTIGYNGPPAGEDNMGCREASVGSCGCVHAEANCLIKNRCRSRDLVMFVTKSPCEHCAGLIINSRNIGAVLYDAEYRDRAGLDLLSRAGVIVLTWEVALGNAFYGIAPAGGAS